VPDRIGGGNRRRRWTTTQTANCEKKAGGHPESFKGPENRDKNRNQVRKARTSRTEKGFTPWKKGYCGRESAGSLREETHGLTWYYDVDHL